MLWILSSIIFFVLRLLGSLSFGLLDNRVVVYAVYMAAAIAVCILFNMVPLRRNNQQRADSTPGAQKSTNEIYTASERSNTRAFTQNWKSVVFLLIGLTLNCFNPFQSVWHFIRFLIGLAILVYVAYLYINNKDGIVESFKQFLKKILRKWLGKWLEKD